MDSILITGGAGYIGSHIALALTTRGHDVVVLDDLSTGRADAVHAPAELVRGALNDRTLLDTLFSGSRFSAVIHCAGSIVVSESVAEPLAYYRNNLCSLIALLETMAAHGVPNILFSSSAAVYGLPDATPIPEDATLSPINPYGRSKLASEWIIDDACAAVPGMRALHLRYFNVAGADPEGRTGESTPNATHLVKIACQAALGKREALDIYGRDYPTKDGTCVRDYIHVSDLADIHALALEALAQGRLSGACNCGYGHGFSVLEVIQAVKRVSGVDFPVRDAARRPGDPPVLVAGTDRFRQALDFRPRFDDLDTIVAHALAWEKTLG